MRLERKSDHWMPLSSFRSPSLGIQCNAYFPCFSHCSTAPALSFEILFSINFTLFAHFMLHCAHARTLVTLIKKNVVSLIVGAPFLSSLSNHGLVMWLFGRFRKWQSLSWHRQFRSTRCQQTQEWVGTIIMSFLVFVWWMGVICDITAVLCRWNVKVKITWLCGSYSSPLALKNLRFVMWRISLVGLSIFVDVFQFLKAMGFVYNTFFPSRLPSFVAK